MDKKLLNQEPLKTTAQKEANDFQWYKDKVNILDVHGTRGNYGVRPVDTKRMQVNYDLYNNILDLEEMKHVIGKFKSDLKGMPAKMENKDALSQKIKSIMGLEMSRPFDYKILALNKEASVRKTEEFNKRIKTFVTNRIIAPIQEQAQMEAEAQFRGQELTPEVEQQIKEMVAQALETQTPDVVKEYMEMSHQDPAEIMHHRLFEYLTHNLDLRHIFNNGVKHAAIAAKEFYWVGEAGRKPVVRVANPLFLDYDTSPEIDFIEDGEWASYEYRMTPSQVVSFFGGELTAKEIRDIYDMSIAEGLRGENFSADSLFQKEGSIIELSDFSNNVAGTIRVFHGTWKSLRKVCFLTYLDEETGDVRTMQVDEDYKLNYDIGDIEMEFEWIPEAYETYKIGDNIYKRTRPIPGQYRDIHDVYTCKLPYYGAIYDATNSTPTSILDRGKNLQYYLNVAYYRLENLMASDKGKKVMMKMGLVGGDAIDIEEFQYFFETTPFGWLDEAEEGLNYDDINQGVKVIDLSTASDMRTYVELITMLKAEIGEAMGVSRQMEAQIAQRDAVRNTQQALVQNSLILEPFFSLHDKIKRNVSLALIEQAKVTYAGHTEPLVYVLDDMSQQMLELDEGMLSATRVGLYIADNGKTQEIKQTITTLAHAAVQAQQAKLSDVLTIMNETSTTSAVAKLKKAETEAEERLAKVEESRNEAMKQAEEIKLQAQREKNQNDLDFMNAEYDRKERLETIKGALIGMSYNADTDNDGDGENDFFEVAKNQLDAEIKISKEAREEAKLQLDREKEQNRKEEKMREHTLKSKALSAKSTPSK